MTVLLEPALREWYCPACGLEDQTKGHRVESRMHTCPKSAMMTVPMVEKGTDAEIRMQVREDYVGDELVQYGEDGVPYTNAITMRDEGYDNTVYAPTAKASLR